MLERTWRVREIGVSGHDAGEEESTDAGGHTRALCCTDSWTMGAIRRA